MHIDDELGRFLESGVIMIGGTVDHDGLPEAVRFWGLEVLPDRGHLRVQVNTSSSAAIANLAPGGAVAITATDVFTLRSVQVKGSSAGTEPVTATDVIRGERYRAELLRNVVDVERVPESLAQRLLPREFVAFVMTVDEIYDQTPGPGAGAPIATSS